jgi:hypothetical protein
MGLTHAAFQRALERSLGIEVNLIKNEQFPKTFKEIFLELREICDVRTNSDGKRLSEVTDDELWQMIRSAMDFARYPDKVTFDADTKAWDLFTY